MRHPSFAFAALISGSLTLAACGDKEEQIVEIEGPSEPIEVLDGTISDDMLPIDRLRSQAPLAEIIPEDSETSPGGGNSSVAAASAVAAEPEVSDEDTAPEAIAEPVVEPAADAQSE